MADRDAEECGARRDDVTSITCHRPKGHRRYPASLLPSSLAAGIARTTPATPTPTGSSKTRRHAGALTGRYGGSCSASGADS
jgi:hypothetical protein